MTEQKLPHDHGHSLPAVLPGQEHFSAVAQVYKLLADPSRLRIFWLLCHWEECVTNISAMVQMSAPAVSHHLRLLTASGLLISRREGKEVYYRAADTQQVRLLHEMIETIEQITCLQ